MERFFSKLMKRNKITAFLELGRPWNSLSVILLSLLGFILYSSSIELWSVFVLTVVVFLIYNGSSAINDLFDMKVDSINMPFRPLERGSIKAKDVMIFCALCYVLGNAIALLISFNFFVSILIMSTVSIFYSAPPISLKDRIFLGNLGLGFVSMFTTLYAGYVMSTNSLIMSSQLLLQATSLTLLFSFFSILKDFKDIGGDNIHGKKTVVTRLGAKKASMLNILGTSVFFLTTILIFYLTSFQNYFFVLISSVIFLLILIPLTKIYKNPTQETGEKYWGMGRLIFLFFLLSLFVF
ncbi:MAG: UbiA family prenyltransferase [Candidatus Aenigmarchaeota archaeon]|nr:UbiA family prenyltransferase [Candidatus Aenigmarchaeota archaeon]